MTDESPKREDIRSSSQTGQVALALGLVCALIAAATPALVVPRFKGVFEAFGAELPSLTTVFVHYNLIFWLIPLAVLLAWLAWPLPQQRPRAALMIGITSMTLVVPATFIAMYLPIFRLAAEQ